MGQPACLEKMTSVKEQGHFIRRRQASKAPTSILSIRSDDRNHKNLLATNKPRPSMTPSRSEPPKAPNRLS